jgi:hypothetical protein
MGLATPRCTAPLPAVTNAAPAPAAPWPHIDGIDTADACERWCGDAPLFMKMLARLLDEFGKVSFPADMQNSQAVAPYVRRMHKLRGGACMLGAGAVYALAGQVEAACIAGDMDRAAELTARLTSEMQCLIVNAQPALTAARIQAQDIAPCDAELGLPLIDDLAALLRQQSLAAIDRFKSLSPQLRHLMGHDSYERMCLHIDNLQFDEASDDLLDSARRWDAAASRILPGITDAAD